MFKVLAIVLGGSVLLLAAGLAYRLWDHGRIRVHSTEQAVEMAKKEAGPLVASLPFRVEQDQDIWIIRFGPDAQESCTTISSPSGTSGPGRSRRVS